MGFVPNKIYGSIIYSNNNRLLLVQGRETGKWSFPKGHRKGEETAYECAFRETKEETGLEIDKSYLEELTLAAGKYYVYKLESEPEIHTIDDNEIMNVEWVPLSVLDKYMYNCDVRSCIMNGHNARHNKLYLDGKYELEEVIAKAELKPYMRRGRRLGLTGTCKKTNYATPEWESYSRFVDYI